MVTRQEILTYARSLVGTPFHHQGRLPGVGLDCVGLIVQVGRHFGLIDYDHKGYSMFPDGATLDREMAVAFTEVPLRSVQPGDLLTFWIRHRSVLQHVAIASDRGMIHTWSNIGRVVEHQLDDRWIERMTRAYAYPGIDPAPHPKAFPIEWPPPLDPAVAEHVNKQRGPRGCCGD